MIDPFLKLLRDMGLSPKELANFKQSQIDYRTVEKDVLKFNNKSLGSKTGTKSFNWKQLYEHIDNTTPENKSNIQQARTEINNIIEEQKEQQHDDEDYGFTSEVKDLILETKKHYEIYAHKSRLDKEVLMTVKYKIEQGYDIDMIVDILNTFNDLWIVYFDTETEHFVGNTENKYFSDILAAGVVLGYE